MSNCICFRFIESLKGLDSQESYGSTLTGAEIKKAKNCWIKSLQALQFEGELQSIKHNQKSNYPIRVRKFGLFLG